MASAPPLWPCPGCGARFVNRNQWHSCGRASVEQWRERMGPRVRDLPDPFQGLGGPPNVEPTELREKKR